MADKITRIAIVDSNRCKPKRCAQECKKVQLFHLWLYRSFWTELIGCKLVMSSSQNGCVFLLFLLSFSPIFAPWGSEDVKTE